MAKMEATLPTELIKQLETFENDGAGFMMDEMLENAADFVVENVEKNAKKVFKNPDTILRGLKKTKVYKTPTDDAVNIKVGIYGYKPDSSTAKFPKGIPLPLIANAKEYGSKVRDENHEGKKPFFRPAFKKAKIQDILERTQDKYLAKYFGGSE